MFHRYVIFIFTVNHLIVWTKNYHHNILKPKSSSSLSHLVWLTTEKCATFEDTLQHYPFTAYILYMHLYTLTHLSWSTSKFYFTHIQGSYLWKVMYHILLHYCLFIVTVLLLQSTPLSHRLHKISYVLFTKSEDKAAFFIKRIFYPYIGLSG